MAEIERRALALDELRMDGGEGDAPRRMVGHAAVFNAPADIGGLFHEQVAPGAFARAIAEDDVRALFNHDPSAVLGRNRAGTLTLREDATGLSVEIAPPDTQLARDVVAGLERGDINQMSFGFRVRRETWDNEQEPPLRTLEEVELLDVSVVTYPAYPTTEVGLRHLEASRVDAQAARRAERQPASNQRRRRLMAQRLETTRQG